MTGWKILNHDFRAPIQGGEPIWDGVALPHILPTVKVDDSEAECSYGWNFFNALAEAISIAGLWRTGRPNAMFAVDAPTAVKRKTKYRAADLTLVRLATEDEIRAAITDFSKVFQCPGIDQEQWLWYQALGRPMHDEQAVIVGLQQALEARGLSWTLRRFDTARDARDAWDAREAWAARDAWAAWAAWDAWAARDASDAWAAWGPRAARAARDARDARDAWDAWDARDAWAARAACAAWDARAALSVHVAAARGWISHDRHLLTTGLRDAYRNGLDVALPTGPNKLGYVMGADL